MNAASSLVMPDDLEAAVDEANGGRSAAATRALHPATPSVLSWENICVTVKDSKGKERVILKNCSGVAEPGSLGAIMGPSGCGKRFAQPSPTQAQRPRLPCSSCSKARKILSILRPPRGFSHSTILDAISGRLSSSAKLEGRVCVNGNVAQLSFGGSAFVTQDEVRSPMCTDCNKCE